MEDSWVSRDLPILDAIVQYFDGADEPLQAGIPTEGTFAEITGRDLGEVRASVRALRRSYLVVQDGGLGASMIVGVTDAARRAVGQWPSAEAMADRVAAALREAADREQDPQKKSKLRTAAEIAGGFARDFVIDALASIATKPIGM
jgi:hypothetical protein